MAKHSKTASGSIGAGQSLSNGVLLGDYTLAGIAIGSPWTAAPITYQASFDYGNTWQELNNSAGTAVSIPSSTTAGTYYAIDVRDPSLTGVTMLKVRSGTVASPVVQTAGGSFFVVMRLVYPGMN